MDVIIVNDVTRLTRDFDEMMSMILLLRKHDTMLHTVRNGEVDIDDPISAAIEVVKAGVSFEKKVDEIERGKEAIQKRMNDGKWQGKPPYGAMMDDDGDYLVKNDDEMENVKKIMKMRDEGCTYEEINEETGISSSTACQIMERRQMYDALMSGHKMGHGGKVVVD